MLYKQVDSLERDKNRFIDGLNNDKNMLYKHINGLNEQIEDLKKEKNEQQLQIETLKKDILGYIQNQTSKFFYLVVLFLFLFLI
jgi:hypothetical protein